MGRKISDVSKCNFKTKKDENKYKREELKLGLSLNSLLLSLVKFEKLIKGGGGSK